ncbi:hypothetical protein HDU87_000687 [Geranomyces variabilis]|uniref:Uncharacterized protein n=1 Tax=Geranomyces variabilis TaxID=109894 RepID=A0AAD5XP61_9FUNG|nr:hypothetical protein HDU87_000687 [Geranomyces variabilis]
MILVGLGDPYIGLRDVQVQLVDNTRNRMIRDWLSIGVPLSISLTADENWLYKTLLPNTRAVNNVNMTADGTTLKFVLNDTSLF